MAYIKWKGIDLSGTQRTGVMAVRSTQELALKLFQQDIALLSSSNKKPLPIIHTLPLHEKIDFFKQIALLLSSGIFLDQALLLVMHYTKKKFFKEIINDILLDVQHGTRLSMALKNYPTVFDSLTVQMIETGEESGKLVEALEHLCMHQEMVFQFKKKVKAVLLMPCITFLFFIAIASVIFIVIVPTLGSMIVSSGQNLSTTTHILLMVSDFVRNWKSMLFFVVASSGLMISAWYLFTFSHVKRFLHYCLVHTPFLGQLLYDTTFVYFFQSLAILTKTGVHTMTALSIAHQSIGNRIIQGQIGWMLDAVQEGHSLSKAAMQDPRLFSEHVQALLSVGQESSCLPFIFGQIAMVYKERIDKFLTTMATLVQPLLMIILGLLITALVFAVYVPLFNLSSVIA